MAPQVLSTTTGVPSTQPACNWSTTVVICCESWCCACGPPHPTHTPLGIALGERSRCQQHTDLHQHTPVCCPWANKAAQGPARHPTHSVLPLASVLCLTNTAQPLVQPLPRKQTAMQQRRVSTYSQSCKALCEWHPDRVQTPCHTSPAASSSPHTWVTTHAPKQTCVHHPGLPSVYVCVW